MTDLKNENNAAPVDSSTTNENQPDWIAKTPKGYGRNSSLERIGVAWNREDGGIGIRLAGTQIIENDILLYPNEKPE